MATAAEMDALNTARETLPAPRQRGLSAPLKRYFGTPLNALITPPAVGSAQQPVAGLESTCTNVVAESTPESYGCVVSDWPRQ